MRRGRILVGAYRCHQPVTLGPPRWASVVGCDRYDHYYTAEGCIGVRGEDTVNSPWNACIDTVTSMFVICLVDVPSRHSSRNTAPYVSLTFSFLGGGGSTYERFRAYQPREYVGGGRLPCLCRHLVPSYHPSPLWVPGGWCMGGSQVFMGGSQVFIFARIFSCTEASRGRGAQKPRSPRRWTVRRLFCDDHRTTCSTYPARDAIGTPFVGIYQGSWNECPHPQQPTRMGMVIRGSAAAMAALSCDLKLFCWIPQMSFGTFFFGGRWTRWSVHVHQHADT